MLSKIRGAALWSRRGAVAALAMIVPLAIPGVASADGGPSAAANSIQYIGVTAIPSWDTEAAVYDNSVYATSEDDWRTPFKFDFKVAQTDAALITADNYAEADVSRCGHCAATAIAFQVVIVSKHALAKLSATDTALATTEHCTTCHGLAEAFQIVYATDAWSAQQWLVPYAAYRVASQLRALQYSHLGTDQVKARSTSLIDNFISWLQSNCEESTGLLPVINGPGQTVKLTGDNRPYISLLSAFQH